MWHQTREEIHLPCDNGTSAEYVLFTPLVFLILHKCPLPPHSATDITEQKMTENYTITLKHTILHKYLHIILMDPWTRLQQILRCSLLSFLLLRVRDEI